MDDVVEGGGEGEGTVEISDGKGKVIRKYSSKTTNEEANTEEEEFGFGVRSEKLPGDAGLNRFVWDMRYEAPSRVPRAISWGGRPSGPLAAPGTYHVKLVVGGKAHDTTAEIKKDPRVESSQAGLD